MKAIKPALAKLQAFFQERETRPGVLARLEMGTGKPSDAKLAELICNERRTHTRMDGSLGGSLFQTAWAAWEMMDLGIDALHGGLDRLLAWVLVQVEGGVGPTPEPLPLAMPSGVAFRAPDDAAFATRCLAVRTLVRARHGERPGVAREIDAIATGRQPPTLDLSASVLSALALAPPAHRHHLGGLVGRVGAAQGADGAWPGTDLFHLLDALLLAGIRPARALIAKAAPALLARQLPGGAFDEPPHEERALIGLRALQVAAES